MLLPLLAVLLTWALAAPLLVGVGHLASRAMVTRLEDLSAFWLGLAATLIGLQWWHLLFPVGAPALALVTVLGLAGWWSEWHRGRRFTRPSLRGLAWSVLVLAMAVWVAARSLGAPTNDDTGVYHLGAVRWASEAPVVPGIGHIHPFLAVNHGFFLFAALLSKVPWSPGPQHVSNGLLACGAIALTLRGLVDCMRSGGPRRGASIAEAILFPWALFAAQGPDMTTLSSDVCEVTLGVAFVSRWADAALAPDSERVDKLSLAFFLMLALIVVKLSAAGALVGTVAAIVALAPTGTRGRLTRIGALLGLLAGAPWSLGVVLRSGYLPYPGAVFAFPVDWRLPRPLVVALDQWTLAYGRGTRATWDLTDTPWFLTRLDALLTQYREFVVPLLLALAWLVAAQLARRRLQPLWFALPALAGVALWLSTSPNLRYAGIWVQALPALFAASLMSTAFKRAASIGACVVAALLTLDFASELNFAVPTTPTLATPTASGTWVTNSRGVTAFVVEQQLCWDAPRPCTPALDEAVEQRPSGNGYRLAPSVDLETYRPATLGVFPPPSQPRAR